MMWRAYLSCGLAALAACAGPREAVDPRVAAEAAIDQAMRREPPPEPIALPVPQPPTRVQSEIETMSHADLARWALPPREAGDIIAADLLRGMMPRLGGIAFYRPPRATAQPGVCEIQGYDVWMRVPDEGRLSHSQHLDPPLQPYQFSPVRRWKVVGSTIAAREGAPDCAAARPYRDWFEAPSSQAVYRAASLVERAQRRPDRVRIVCRQMRYEEARGDYGFPACPDPAALLERLTPDLIKRVRPADCTLDPSPRSCLGIEYHDPAAPGTHSLYLVTVPDEDRPGYVQITQGLLPPH